MEKGIRFSKFLIFVITAGGLMAGIPAFTQSPCLRFSPKMAPLPEIDLPAFPLLALPGFPLKTENKDFQPSMVSLPAAYNFQKLAFFCKVEVRMEKSARLPVKFRLGSVDYVDRLEQKRVWVKD